MSVFSILNNSFISDLIFRITFFILFVKLTEKGWWDEILRDGDGRSKERRKKNKEKKI